MAASNELNPPPPRRRLGKTVLLAYHWRDEEVYREVVKRLYSMAEGFIFTPFHDGDLLKRKDWQAQAAEQVRSCEVALLMISPGFLESDALRQVADSFVLRQGRFIKLTVLAVNPSKYVDSLPGPALPSKGRAYGDLPEETREGCLRDVAGALLTTLGLKGEVQEQDRSAPPEPDEELVRACLAQQCVLVAGPGLRPDPSLPGSAAFSRGLIEKAQGEGEIDPSFAQALMQEMSKGIPGHVLDAVVDALPPTTTVVLKFLREVLKNLGAKPPDVYSKLPGIGFSGVVTTTYDDALPQAFHIPPERRWTIADAEPLLQAISKKEFFFLNLFGTPARPDSLFLTPARYRDAAASSVAFGQFLSALFFSRTIVFAGFDVETLEGILTSFPTRGSSPPRHVALVEGTEQSVLVKAPSLKRRFGLELVTAAESGASARFLARLAGRVREEQSGSVPPDPVRKPGRIARVAVENIGPFERLEIDLHPGWNVLLGDNGVGKSSILKAIAAAIVGEDAAPFAGRLIRMGATSASVTLTTDQGETYRAELLRSESGARLTSVPVRPLEKEGWLALAFPPLRTVSWERPAPYEAGEQRRAVSGDVLPLVRGEADPRLDKLKAWLLYLDHNIQNQARQKAGSDRYLRLRNEFFRIVKKVTPGVNLDFGRVDPSKKQVYVRTDDGEVPIEAVSQGTQSLMGWIGIVLQRLFEVHDQEADPTRKFVLVLMDEIDAHMHPHWQHVLVSTLKEIFPDAQFVASSHSPLVVSGLKKEEVLIFRRDDATGRKVKVERPEEDLKGWRVDQILTSATFGLGGARDKESVDRLSRYTELVSKFDRSPGEEKEIAALAASLEATVPAPQSLPQAREASKMIEEAVRAKLDALPEAERKKVVEEMRVQVQEAMTGARRPS